MNIKDQKKVFFSNLLGPERIVQLLAKNDPKTKLDGSNIVITDLERELSLCSHRYDNSSYLLPIEDDTKLRCKICDDKFHLIMDASEEDLKLAVENILDILNSIKFSWIEVNEESAREFYSIIAIIRKIPEMYKATVKSINSFYAPPRPTLPDQAQMFSSQNHQYLYQPFVTPYQPQSGTLIDDDNGVSIYRYESFDDIMKAAFNRWDHDFQETKDGSQVPGAYNPNPWDQFNTGMGVSTDPKNDTSASPVKVVKAKRNYTKKNKSPVTE